MFCTPDNNRLPPLTSHFPQWSRTGKINPGHNSRPYSDGDKDDGIQRVTKKYPDMIGSRSEGLLFPSMSTDPLLRITQLEQNLHFLQEQHQIMLSSLHHEVEILRQRNRDLQFQLVFSKGGISLLHSGSDSSPEDDIKPKALSPKQHNTQPLQVEMLEKDVAELRAALSEANTSNAALTALLEQQKKQLEAAGTKNSEAEYDSKLEEAEKLIRRLRRENEDQRREMASLRASFSKSNGNTGGSGRHANGRRGGGGQLHDQQQHRFPPLHSQSYWHHSQQHTHDSPEFSTQSNNTNNGQKRGGGVVGNGGRGGIVDQGGEIVGQAAPTLPHLSRNFSQPSGSNSNRSRYYSNGNHYYGHRSTDSEGGRKYRKYRGNREPSQ